MSGLCNYSLPLLLFTMRRGRVRGNRRRPPPTHRHPPPPPLPRARVCGSAASNPPARLFLYSANRRPRSHGSSGDSRLLSPFLTCGLTSREWKAIELAIDLSFLEPEERERRGRAQEGHHRADRCTHRVFPPPSLPPSPNSRIRVASRFRMISGFRAFPPFFFPSFF